MLLTCAHIHIIFFTSELFRQQIVHRLRCSRCPLSSTASTVFVTFCPQLLHWVKWSYCWPQLRSLSTRSGMATMQFGRHMAGVYTWIQTKLLFSATAQPLWMKLWSLSMRWWMATTKLWRHAANMVVCIVVNARMKAVKAKIGIKCHVVLIVHVRFPGMTTLLRTLPLRLGWTLALLLCFTFVAFHAWWTPRVVWINQCAVKYSWISESLIPLSNACRYQRKSPYYPVFRIHEDRINKFLLSTYSTQ